jgi:hypothetical protein
MYDESSVQNTAGEASRYGARPFDWFLAISGLDMSENNAIYRW